MEQYISKSALVAEIEDKINKYTKRGEESDAKRDGYAMYWGGVLSCLNEVRSFLDTLEVKEVDLEKETKKWWKERLHLNPENQLWMDAHQSLVFAKHFFELGINARKEDE